MVAWLRTISKLYFSYHRYTTPVVLIGLPVVLVVSGSLYIYDNAVICHTQHKISAYDAIFYTVIVIMLFIYPLRPFLRNWLGRQSYHGITDSEAVVSEYKTVKHIISFASPVAVISAIIYAVVITNSPNPNHLNGCEYLSNLAGSNIYIYSIFQFHDASLLVLYAALLRMASMRLRKEFRLKQAKGYFIILDKTKKIRTNEKRDLVISGLNQIQLQYASLLILYAASIHLKKKFRLNGARGYFIILDKTKKIRTNEKRDLVIRGLNSYNKYLRRHLRLQIKDLQERYYDFIVSASTIKEDTFMDSISKAFIDNDRLRPVKCLSIFLTVPKKEQLLIKEESKLKIKDWITTVLGTIAIPLFAALIPLFFHLPK